MEANYLTDQELVQQFVNGNQKAIEVLIARHKRKVYSYILMVVKNRELAADIFQDTFIKVIRSLKQGKYQDNGKFISWICRIAHNLVIDHFRKERQLKMISNDNYESDLFNTPRLSEKNFEARMLETQVRSDIRALLDTLPEDQREVVIMRHYLDMSFKEIADATNVSINTALGRMRYALINLRKMMEEKNISLTV
jgi:RNA polymerase sigma factor (sigma-70 family)